MKLTFFGKAVGGEVRIWGNHKVASEIAERFDGKDFKITVETKRDTRSNKQNSYYWSCVVGMIKDRINELGNDYDEDEVHDWLKANFNKSDDAYLGIPKSTRRLSTTEFEEYVEKCKMWASEFLGIYIPDPNEQSIMSYE